MEQLFGKVIVIQPGGPEQVYELGKATINIGRSMTSDIILSDARVSRNHARLDLSSSGCAIVDLQSSNGTRVNGVSVEHSALYPGDNIIIGNTQLRFEAYQPLNEAGMTVIDSEADLDVNIDHESLPVSVHETGVPRLVVFTNGITWDMSLEDVDYITIGRTEENEICIPNLKVSRKHAEVHRKGDAFLLQDLGSTNGTWFQKERVDQLVLEDGDSVRIGNAQLVFKSGFQAQALTFAGASLIMMPKRRPVVFVPGFMGSELWLGNERVWPNVKYLFKNPEIFTFPSAIPLEPRAILDEVVIVPNLLKLDQYNRLGDYLVEDLGYERGKDFFEFAYDWRQDVRISAGQLGQMIQTLPVSEPVTIIGHSLGTLVSRYYIECMGGKDKVERVILMGGPHHGVVKALTSLLMSADLLPFGIMGERLRQLVASFPTSYQILPTFSCGADQNGNKINFLKDDSWLEGDQQSMLRKAKQFRQELGYRSSVPAISIFGYGKKTITGISLKRSTSGKFSNIVFQTDQSGDSTILEKSAVLEGTEIHPVQQYHGLLFVDNDVKMRLKLELARLKY